MGLEDLYVPLGSGNPGANLPAIVNVPARPGFRVVIGTILASYSAAPAAGRVTLSDGSGPRIDLDITATGPTGIPLGDTGLAFEPSQGVQVVLAAGGAAVVGKVNVGYKYVAQR